jgi:hypothetical protein
MHIDREFMNDLGKKWSYWNVLSTRIPENIGDLSESEKLELSRQWDALTHTENVQPLDVKLQNIKDVPLIILQAVPKWIMDRAKEAADDYVKGRWLSSIFLCGVIAEYLSFYLLENYVRETGIQRLITHSRRLGNQSGRLRCLKDIHVLDENQWDRLESIRRTRNDYAHLDKIETNKIKPDALRSVQNLINFLNTHESFQLKF